MYRSLYQIMVEKTKFIRLEKETNLTKTDISTSIGMVVGVCFFGRTGGFGAHRYKEINSCSNLIL